MIAIAATTLLYTLHTYSQAQSAMTQVSNLTHDLAQLRLIQLSQATYEEQRINTLSERVDNTTNRLESRVQILEARRQITIQ